MLFLGNFGDCKPLREEVSELRIGWAWIRVWAKSCMLLLCGGDKRKQSSDVKRAIDYLKDYKDSKAMKHKARISHDDEAMSRELRDNADFAAEYLRAALDDEYEPRILLVALRRVARHVVGLPKWVRLLVLNARAFT